MMEQHAEHVREWYRLQHMQHVWARHGYRVVVLGYPGARSPDKT